MTLLDLLSLRLGKMQRIAYGFALVLTIFNPVAGAEEMVRGRKSLVIQNQTARLVIDLGGGSIGELRFQGTGEGLGLGVSGWPGSTLSGGRLSRNSSATSR